MSILINSVQRPATTKASSLECAIGSYSWCRMTFDEVNAFRKQSDALPGSLGNSLLRHADEQTLAGLVAVRDATERFDSPQSSFADWGVVCSSRYLGRSAFAQSLSKFAEEGPWNVSVQVVPNRSLHSPASMIGLALGCHGPCVGVGGGLDGETDAWLTAMTLLDQHRLPGIWLMFIGWEPDRPIDVKGNVTQETCCTGLAIGLQPAGSKGAQARLSIAFDHRTPTALEIPASQTAVTMFQKYASSNSRDEPLRVMLGGGLRAEIDMLPTVISALTQPQAVPISSRKAA